MNNKELKNLSQVGVNCYHSKSAFEHYPLEIIQSPTNTYFLIFDTALTISPTFITKELEHLNFSNIINVTGENVTEISLEDSFLGTLFYYPYFGMALAKFSSEQLSLIESRRNNFTVQPEREIRGVHLKNDENEVSVPDRGYADWGIDLVNTQDSGLDGNGLKVAVLDTGFQEDHPDYASRNICRTTFVGSILDDDNGHGMHTAGIAFGNSDIENNIRYGIANNTHIFSAKILDFTKKGLERNILNGIIWAIDKGCRVILICVEIPNNGHGYPDDYHMHNTITNALHDDNIFVVTAAGNTSKRSLGAIHKLGKPASYQYSLAVGSINKGLKVSDFSNRAGRFQTLNYCAPGERIYSSWSSLGRPSVLRKPETGTSMAAPFIAGILALLVGKFPQATYQSILNLMDASLISEKNWEEADYGKGMPTF